MWTPLHQQEGNPWTIPSKQQKRARKMKGPESRQREAGSPPRVRRGATCPLPARLVPTRRPETAARGFLLLQGACTPARAGIKVSLGSRRPASGGAGELRPQAGARRGPGAALASARPRGSAEARGQVRARGGGGAAGTYHGSNS